MTCVVGESSCLVSDECDSSDQSGKDQCQQLLHVLQFIVTHMTSVLTLHHVYEIFSFYIMHVTIY